MITERSALPPPVTTSSTRAALIPAGRSERIPLDELGAAISAVSSRHVEPDHAALIAEKVVLAERMGVPTHGLHYFMQTLLPLLEAGAVNDVPIETSGNVVISNGIGGVGFQNLARCLDRASELAADQGIAMAVLSLPGKVGALRTFCPQLTARGNLVLLAKNTARAVGTGASSAALLGSNPLCIALPGTGFIYDSSTATVASNKVRLLAKAGATFPAPVGVDAELRPSADPRAIAAGGQLLPYSFGPYWFKSFFLGVAIEALAALAGGRTGSSSGEPAGRRLHSSEGMLAIVVDRGAFDRYDEYVAEMDLLLGELSAAGLRVPGEYDPDLSHVDLLQEDWRALRAV